MSDQPQQKDRKVLALSGEAVAHLWRIIAGEIPYAPARPGDDPCPLCEEIRSALSEEGDDQGEGHRVEIEFDGESLYGTLVHPATGCTPPIDEESGEPIGDEECWITGWFDEHNTALLFGKITLAVTEEWDGDSARLHVNDLQPAAILPGPSQEDGELVAEFERRAEGYAEETGIASAYRDAAQLVRASRQNASEEGFLRNLIERSEQPTTLRGPRGNDDRSLPNPPAGEVGAGADRGASAVPPGVSSGSNPDSEDRSEQPATEQVVEERHHFRRVAVNESNRLYALQEAIDAELAKPEPDREQLRAIVADSRVEPTELPPTSDQEEAER